MSFEFTTLAGLKSLAGNIQAEQGVPRHQALELAARRGGFAAYVDAIGQVFPGRAIRAGLVLTATATWLPLIA